MAELVLEELPDRYVVHRLSSNLPVPSPAEPAGLFSVTRTCDELTVICPESTGIDSDRSEHGFHAFRVAGTLDFSLVGIVHSLTAPLAEAKVSVFVISTFDTDYLLVQAGAVDAAVAAWQAAGFPVQRSRA